ncbi:peptidase [Pradoshia eiseniae]|uniref:Peptidase n=1 Tax=Pradoshia eiseniae TaxID=2064768 RepID=A0A2S7N4Z9_9BACI|nr:M14 family metallocarboxypeptidase [Pradoshia eiseniae]PQD97096.1 peptidase [Pradoshia eiseniae]
MKKLTKKTTSAAIALAIGSALLASVLPASAAQEDEFIPYYGKGPSYIQPDDISHLFPKPQMKFQTPGFAKGKTAFTSQEEMTAFLKKLSKKNKHMSYKIIGKSLEGKEIPMIIFSKNPDNIKKDKKKPLIWVQGQIHGNEPAAGESNLVLAQMIAEGKLGNVLDKANIIIVPRINPDGSYYFKRFIATDMDANRDYMKVEYPEVRTVYKAINEYQPDVVLDTHEYTVNSSLLTKYGEEGSIASYDVLISSAKNLNIPEDLRKTSDKLLLPDVQKALKKEKLSFHDYYTLSSSNGKLVAEEGSTETRIGRNALGLKNTFTYLIETRGINIGRADFERRVFAQVTAQTNFIKSAIKNADKVKRTVEEARKTVVNKGKNANDNDKIVIMSENKLVPDQELTVVDLAKAYKVDIPIDWKSSSDAYPTLERERPTAYILPPAYHSIADKLKVLGVKVEKLKKSSSLSVESYKVTENEVSTQLESGHYTNKVKTEVSTKKKTFPAGSYVFKMDQPNANYIALALEPEGVDSYVTFNFIPVEKGDEIPVYRYMEEGGLRTNR